MNADRITMLVRQRMGEVQRADQLHCDRTKWKDGPWNHEGFDNFAWYDFDTGYTCQMVRNHSGAWCGYVSVPDDHPLRHVGYHDDKMPDLDVHGGITFSDEGWFGFDCNHTFDDCPLLGGTAYFTASDVIEEVTRLAAQLKEHLPCRCDYDLAQGCERNLTGGGHCESEPLTIPFAKEKRESMKFWTLALREQTNAIVVLGDGETWDDACNCKIIQVSDEQLEQLADGKSVTEVTSDPREEQR